MHNPWVLEIEEVGNWTSQWFSGDPPCNLPEQQRAGLKAVGNVSKPVEPSSGHSSTLNKQLNSLSLSLFSFFFWYFLLYYFVYGSEQKVFEPENIGINVLYVLDLSSH